MAASQPTKTCVHCQQVNPVDQFRFRRNLGKIIPSTTCKDCHNARQRQERASDPERFREAEKRYRRFNLQMSLPRHGRKKNQQHIRTYYKRHPEIYAAHNKVKWAVRTGSLKRPANCENCGASGRRIEASHSDYSKPLDVEWLCVPCHRAKDRINRMFAKLSQEGTSP